MFVDNSVRHISIYVKSPDKGSPESVETDEEKAAKADPPALAAGTKYFFELTKSSERIGLIVVKSYSGNNIRIWTNAWSPTYESDGTTLKYDANGHVIPMLGSWKRLYGENRIVYSRSNLNPASYPEGTIWLKPIS
jgi:hypothetical protein